MTVKSADTCKIIIAGPVAAGKTTAINIVSDIDAVNTDENSTDATKHLKQETTVAMDYGLLLLSDGSAVHLYGAPGQDRFDYMWDILGQGALGLVLLINNNVPLPLKELDHFLNAFSELITKTALVIGITKMDIQEKPSIEQYHQHLAKKGMNIPVFEVDARDKNDIQVLLRVLLYSI